MGRQLGKERLRRRGCSREGLGHAPPVAERGPLDVRRQLTRQRLGHLAATGGVGHAGHHQEPEDRLHDLAGVPQLLDGVRFLRVRLQRQRQHRRPRGDQAPERRAILTGSGRVRRRHAGILGARMPLARRCSDRVGGHEESRKYGQWVDGA